jgi:hypothetical protein
VLVRYVILAMAAVLAVGVVSSATGAMRSPEAAPAVTSATVNGKAALTLRGPRGRRGPRGYRGRRGLQGPQGPPGPVNLSGLGAAESATTFIAPGDVGSATAVCPVGQRAVSGGGSMISGLGDGLAVSRASGDRSTWFVIAVNNSSFTTAELKAVAYCAGGGQAVAASRWGAVRREVAAAVERFRAVRER